MWRIAVGAWVLLGASAAHADAPTPAPEPQKKVVRATLPVVSGAKSLNKAEKASVDGQHVTVVLMWPSRNGNPFHCVTIWPWGHSHACN